MTPPNNQISNNDEARMTNDQLNSNDEFQTWSGGSWRGVTGMSANRIQLQPNAATPRNIRAISVVRVLSFGLRHLFGIRDEVGVRGPSAFSERHSRLGAHAGIATANRSAGAASPK